jgi:hypothetical protein
MHRSAAMDHGHGGVRVLRRCGTLQQPTRRGTTAAALSHIYLIACFPPLLNNRLVSA